MENTNQTPSHEPQKKMKTNPLLIKAFIMIGFTILLSIPMYLISDLVDDRESLQIDAVNDIERAFGGNSTITGPYLTVPYEVIITYNEGKASEYEKTIVENFIIFPEFFTGDVQIQSEILQRGIYPVPTFEADFNGDFIFNLAEAQKVQNNLDWTKAILIFEVDNTKGIVEIPRIESKGLHDAMRPAQKEGYFMNKRLEFPIDLQNSASFAGSISGKFRGVETFRLLPIAGSNKLNVNSDWPSPDLGRGLIASNRDIDDFGSSAGWNVTRLHTSLPEYSYEADLADNIPGYNSYIVFNMYQENGLYQKTHRALSYGMFIICLAYVIFFLIDIKSKIGLHPLQYLILGAGFALFYLLLLALSEYISFQLAYIIASISIIWISGYYYGSIVRSFKKGATLSAAYSIIFAYIYFVIASVEYALIAGAVGLLVVFYLVAFSTRKLKQLKET